MKHTIKRVLLCIVAMSIVLIKFNSCSAHPGRTDSNGGHKDNKNVSGLGPYHYHCGGNPAHLHPDGICPYSAEAKKSSNADITAKESENKTNTTQAKTETKVIDNKNSEQKNTSVQQEKNNSNNTTVKNDNENTDNMGTILTLGVLGGAGYLGYKKHKNK